MSDFFDQQAPEKPVQERRYSHPGSDKMYQRPERPKKPEIPEGERKYLNSPKIYGDQQPKDGLPLGTHEIKNHLTGARVLLQAGYLGRDGFKRCLESNHRDLKFADLRDKDLSNIHLDNANFANSKMNSVNFKKTVAQRANFDNSELWGISFDGANLHGSSFRDVDLSYCSMKNCNLRGADLRGAVLPTGADIAGADMTGAIMNDSE